MDFVDMVIEESKWNTATYINGRFEFIKRRYPPHLCTPTQWHLVEELKIYNRILTVGDFVHITQVLDKDA